MSDAPRTTDPVVYHIRAILIMLAVAAGIYSLIHHEYQLCQCFLLFAIAGQIEQKGRTPRRYWRDGHRWLAPTP